MIEEIKAYGLDSPRVFSAMLQVPREEFVPWQFRYLAYKDNAVSIGHGQTISQPYTVAFMTDLLGLDKEDRVLEIGTGSGYQAAILSYLAKEVYTIEIISELAKEAKERLRKLGYTNIHVKKGSGEHGWKNKAPFDAIIVTAATKKVSKELFGQLKTNGRLVAPIGGRDQQTMTRYIKEFGGKLRKEKFQTYVFVPLVSEK